MSTWGTPSSPRPGWYPDPGQPTALRWWDGASWTDHRTAAWQPPMASPTAPGAAAHPDLTWVVPVNRDGFAIASGYLGLLSLFPNPVTSTAAVVCGGLALRRMKTSRRMGRGRAWFGIVAGALSAILFVAVVVAATTSSSTSTPGTAPARQQSASMTGPPAPTQDPVSAPAPLRRADCVATCSRILGSLGASTGISRVPGAPRQVVLALPGEGDCYFVSVTEGAPNRYGVANGMDAASHCFVDETADGVPQARPETQWADRWPAPSD